mmetsp:Transcript_40109/g.100737  ORF Transcript_40109/g.100737 Transcript_40109/m.100737 type:complete len:229 (-) Transcript_40109:715-1401(-)
MRVLRNESELKVQARDSLGQVMPKEALLRDVEHILAEGRKEAKGCHVQPDICRRDHSHEYGNVRAHDDEGHRAAHQSSGVGLNHACWSEQLCNHPVVQHVHQLLPHEHPSHDHRKSLAHVQGEPLGPRRLFFEAVLADFDPVDEHDAKDQELNDEGDRADDQPTVFDHLGPALSVHLRDSDARHVLLRPLAQAKTFAHDAVVLRVVILPRHELPLVLLRLFHEAHLQQ